MIEAPHTPGPWTLEDIQDYGEDAIPVLFLSGPDIALCRLEEKPDTIADARLMAAAPDLLLALEAMLFNARHGNGLAARYKAHGRAEAAIAKARGE